MGLIEDGDDHYVLSDILGSEDHNGDMDFKVTGTRTGVCALQMDIKIKGLSADLLKRAMAQAKQGRLHILEKMGGAIDKARDSISKWAPQITSRKIPVDKIGALIGPGGKVIRGLQAEFNCRIEVDDEGVVNIASGPEGNLEAAVAAVDAITGDAEVGAIYKGKVVSIREFGAFVEIAPGKEGLLHISNISTEHVKDVNDVLKQGQELDVRCISIDDFGRIRLAHPDVEVSEDKRGGGGGGGGGGGRRDREPKELPPVDAGAIYDGKVTGVKPYGVFVELVPGREGLCHVSEMLPKGLRDVEKKFSMGDACKVKVLEIEDNGKLRLSMRAAADEGGEGEGERETVSAGASDEGGEEGGEGSSRRRRPRRRREGGEGESGSKGGDDSAAD